MWKLILLKIFSKFMTTTVIIPTKNEVIGIREILPKVDHNWANDWFIIF